MATDPELRHRIALLHRDGWAQRRIALELDISRKQVRTVLVQVYQERDHGTSALPKRPAKRARQLDAFESVIQRRLDECPDISAVRMLEDLRGVGFEGSYGSVKKHLRALRPKPKAAAVERFETGPGQQGQQDWSPYRIDFTQEERRRLRAFSFVLGFSRRQYVHFCEREEQRTLMRQHQGAFDRFRGVPREILYDNQKAIVLRREANRPIYHPTFLAFATHYGFRPVALPPRRPELKGKVERPFQYIEGNLLHGRTFATKADLDKFASWWMDNISDLHIHYTTKERPIDRFEREKDFLLPLPSTPYDTSEVGYRVVSDDALVHWEGVRYSVPTTSVLDLVVLRATEHEIFVYSSDLTLLAHHEKAPAGHPDPVLNPAHRPSRKHRHDVELLAERLRALGEPGALFAAGVCSTQRNRGAHLAEVLAHIERYDADDILRAMARATRYRAFDAGVVSRILAATTTPRILPSTEEQRVYVRLREQSADLIGARRSLDEYAAALDPRTEQKVEDS